MSHLSRRQLLAGFLGGLAQAAGTVVLARAVLSEAVAEGKEASAPRKSRSSFQERADQVAGEQGPLEGEDLHPVAFVNGGFRNGGGGFRKGGFANGGGGFRKGGFANGGSGGGFRNGGFGNGGGGGGGFRKGGFANGGGSGGGFRNGGFANGGGFRNY
jgi:hypothetical protein